jgi:hypothetical protein
MLLADGASWSMAFEWNRDTLYAIVLSYKASFTNLYHNPWADIRAVPVFDYSCLRRR